MKKLLQKILKFCYITIIVMFTSLSVSQEIGTTGLILLKVIPDAQLSSLADAPISGIDTASTLFVNPSSLFKCNNPNIVLGGQKYVFDVNRYYVAVSYPIKNSVLGLGYLSQSITNIPGRDENNKPTVSYDANTHIAYLTYAFPGLLKEHKFGVNFKYATQTIANYKANSGLVLDVGTVYYDTKNKIDYGLCLQNIIRFTETPVAYILKVGVSYSGFDNLPLYFSLQKPSDNNLSFHFAISKIFHKMFSVQVGYKTGPQDINKLGLLSGLCTGFNFTYNHFQISYAFNPVPTLNEYSHLFAFKYVFSKSEE